MWNDLKSFMGVINLGIWNVANNFTFRMCPILQEKARQEDDFEDDEDDD